MRRRDAQTVRDLSPDLATLGGLDVRGVAVTAPGTGTPYDFVSRWFGAKAGIPEDPVTGSAHAQLAPLWAERLGRTTLTARQLSARGGTVRCRVEGDRTFVTGNCVRFLNGTIALPDWPPGEGCLHRKPRAPPRCRTGKGRAVSPHPDIPQSKENLVSTSIHRTPGQLPILPGSVTANGFVFTSGIIAPSVIKAMQTGGTVPFAQQVTESVDALLAELKAAGSAHDRVVSLDAFLASASDVPRWNEEFLRVWPTPGPARMTLITGFTHPAVLFELRATAVV
ncbi:PhzF family phenazine biosynthesis protein [Streptomyces dysideae]|uniref:Translation initiation inhibitor n=1 Tax=Streptomyces dysideae TaxID=909626 RepID=A0A101UT68_9ACTN|nr:PhzF family phenazine biosynthesis protein [Streptomyces dysideae]KUO16408.1 hypothetical protein AQJ91_35995 [Streptomyces dysideae]